MYGKKTNASFYLPTTTFYPKDQVQTNKQYAGLA